MKKGEFVKKIAETNTETADLIIYLLTLNEEQKEKIKPYLENLKSVDELKNSILLFKKGVE